MRGRKEGKRGGGLRKEEKKKDFFPPPPQKKNGPFRCVKFSLFSRKKRGKKEERGSRIRRGGGKRGTAAVWRAERGLGARNSGWGEALIAPGKKERGGKKGREKGGKMRYSTRRQPGGKKGLARRKPREKRGALYAVDNWHEPHRSSRTTKKGERKKGISPNQQQQGKG